MDTNWFYSTIAQSSAAIVSLLGAILVTRLLDHGNDLRNEKKEIELMLNNCKYYSIPQINFSNLPADLDGRIVVILKNCKICLRVLIFHIFWSTKFWLKTILLLQKKSRI